MRSARLLLLAASLLAACPQADDDDSAAPADDDDATEAPQGWGGVAALIGFRCGCHDAQQRSGGMYDLTDPEIAYGVLVGVPSNAVPALSRIEPFDPERSYLLLKIEGRHGSVGGDGERMPPTGFALRAEQIAMVRAWIEDGAPNE